MSIYKQIEESKLQNFIGTYNMVLLIEGVWYQLPFEYLWDECVISRKRNPAKCVDSLERYMLMDQVTEELISRWDYFEWSVRRFAIEERKTKEKQ